MREIINLGRVERQGMIWEKFEERKNMIKYTVLKIMWTVRNGGTCL